MSILFRTESIDKIAYLENLDDPDLMNSMEFILYYKNEFVKLIESLDIDILELESNYDKRIKNYKKRNKDLNDSKDFTNLLKKEIKERKTLRNKLKNHIITCDQQYFQRNNILRHREKQKN